MRRATRRFALLATGIPLGCGQPPAEAAAPASPLPSASVTIAERPDSGAEVPAVDAGATTPAIISPPAAVSLEFSACRSLPKNRRISITAEGMVTLSEEGAPERRGAVPSHSVEALVNELATKGIASWGDIRCTPTNSSRCGMHPCFTTLRATVGGTERSASTDSDSKTDPRFLDAVVQIQRLAQAWRWSDEALDPDARGPCSTSHDCSLIKDECGGLHAALSNKPKARATIGDCARTVFPKSDVEPSCDSRRCALSPVTPDARSCKRNAECSVVSFCGSWGAIRRDRVKRVALKNDHRACAAPVGPAPAVACLQGVCVTRAP
jgi:hypothetical protein